MAAFDCWRACVPRPGFALDDTNVPGLTAATPMTHIEALALDRLPGHLIVIGGGYIGLELAQAVRRFGSDVTVIEQGAQLAERISLRETANGECAPHTHDCRTGRCWRKPASNAAMASCETG
jgi:NADPH-dependent 2,4-dienoyl-CoA reductase/sulfur reductase-like enzyme